MKWFRFYHEFIDDPKIAMMSDSDQLLWVKALCLANDPSAGERGRIELTDDEICWKLRTNPETWKHAIDKFRAKGLIEHVEGGYAIAAWDKRQYASDSSADRVRKHRAKVKAERRKKEKVTETGQEQNCNVTCNDISSGSASASVSGSESVSEENLERKTESEPREFESGAAKVERAFTEPRYSPPRNPRGQIVLPWEGHEKYPEFIQHLLGKWSGRGFDEADVRRSLVNTRRNPEKLEKATIEWEVFLRASSKKSTRPAGMTDEEFFEYRVAQANAS